MRAAPRVSPTAGRPLLQAGQRAAYRIADLAGIAAALRTFNRRRVPILCYHSVVDRELPEWVAESGSHLPVAQFEAHVQLLARHYRVIPLGELVRALGEGAPPPERSVVITFDDGYVNNLQVAGPILARHGCPATVFLATAYLDSGELFWGDELHLILTRGLGSVVTTPAGTLDLTSEAGVRAARTGLRQRLQAATLTERRALLSGLEAALPGEIPRDLREALRPMTWKEAAASFGRNGLDCGGHTSQHRVLDRIPPAEQTRDIAECRTAIANHGLLSEPAAFCYPAGRTTRHSQAALRTAGFAAGVTAPSSQWAERLAGTGTDLTLLPRLLIGSAMSLSAVAGNAAGLKAVLGGLMRRRAAPPS